MKRKRNKTTNTTRDRISKLPLFIIHHIMSFLPTKDAAKTSVLSKRWQRARAAFPILDFNQTFFKKQVKSRKTFIRYVNKTLRRFRKSGLSVQKARFRVKNINSKMASLVDKWVVFSLENHVKELDIRVLPYRDDSVSAHGTVQTERDLWYSLPQTVFVAKTITSIKLYGCKLEPQISLNDIRFDSLQNLSLMNIQLDEQMMENLIVACPSVQDFVVKYCWGLTKLSIHHLLELKKVDISDLGDKIETVDIQEAPSLQSFTCSMWRNRMSCIINMVGCQDLKNLTLMGNVGTNECFHDLTFKFPLLEGLYVVGCIALNKIVIPRLRLKFFGLHKCENLVDAQIDTPNLSLFSYSGDTVPFSLINAPCKWKLSLVLGHNDSLNTPWYLKLKEFMQNSTEVQILDLLIVSIEYQIDLNDLFGVSFTPNGEIKHSDVDALPPKSDYAALVDGLLQICRPKSLTITSKSEIQGELICYINEKLKDKEGFKHCCSYPHMKCWRHYLEELKAENYEEIEGGRQKSMVTLYKIRLIGSSYESSQLDFGFF